MATALLPLLLTICVASFVVIMGWLFFQFSKPGARLIPILIILAGLTFGAILFLLKLKAFAVVAVVALVAVGFILAATAEPPRMKEYEPKDEIIDLIEADQSKTDKA